MTKALIQVEGANELMRHLKAASDDAREVGRDFRDAYKKAADVVAQDAKRIAIANGLVDSGKLVRSIKARATQKAGEVQATAKGNPSRKEPSGFRYPRLYEFADGYKRPYARPAAFKNRAKVVEVFQQQVEEILRDNRLK